MDVVYIRFCPERPQAVAERPGSSPSLAPTSIAHATARTTTAAATVTTRNEIITTSATATTTHDAPVQVHRRWRVSVRVNDAEPTITTIQDPFLEPQYRTVFESYLRHSDRPSWSAQNMTLENDNGADAISVAEHMIHAYGEQLFAQLGLSASSFTPGVTDCRIYVVEQHSHDSAASAAPGIHCLAWELLEAVHVTRLPKMCLRVTRLEDFPNTPRHSSHLHHHHILNSSSSHEKRKLPARTAQPLSGVQADQSAMFKILLVVARDFTRTGAERDPEPDLAQWPLMTVQKKLRSRMLLEVVRPGSKEELEEHLASRELQGVRFNLVHFDLHGRVNPDEDGNPVPWLMFAKSQHESQKQEYQVPQTHLAKAEAIAQLLARHHIENVVLNACLTAYNRTGSGTSLAHIFLRHGIENVSAMWFYAHRKTVATYLETFYDQLLIKCVDFHVAAQRSRDAIRQKPTKGTGREYQDFFVCVNYKRDEHRPISTDRDPSPTPSARSQDSSTSRESVKSFMSGVWKPSTPRLGESFMTTDEPVLRMRLHLLDLEYKLMTSRIVYASDLGREDQELSKTIERMVGMWLNTNLVDEVLYYRASDFAKRRLLTDSVTPEKKRTRSTNGGYLQLLFPRPVKALRQTLHIIRDVDPVVNPGYQPDEVKNRRNETRRWTAQENLQRFAERLHGERNSFLIFLGHRDAKWYREHLQHLTGEWWLHVPWHFTVHSRYVKDARMQSGAWKPTLGIGAGV